MLQNGAALRLESGVLKLYLVNCIQTKKPEKVKEFFEKMAVELQVRCLLDVRDGQGLYRQEQICSLIAFILSSGLNPWHFLANLNTRSLTMVPFGHALRTHQ